MTLKNIICILTVGFCLSFGQVNAFAGGVGGGGNDPRATELLDYGRRVGAWLASTQNSNKYPHIKTSKILARIEALSATLDLKDPWIKFFDIHEMNCYGTPKKACTYDNGRIDVAGKYWEKASDLDKCQTSVVELMRTSGNKELTYLYETASGLCKQLYQQESETNDGVPTFELIQSKFIPYTGKVFFVKNNPNVVVIFGCGLYTGTNKSLVRIIPFKIKSDGTSLHIDYSSSSDVLSRSENNGTCRMIESYALSKIQNGKTVVFKVLQDGFMVDGKEY